MCFVKENVTRNVNAAGTSATRNVALIETMRVISSVGKNCHAGCISVKRSVILDFVLHVGVQVLMSFLATVGALYCTLLLHVAWNLPNVTSLVQDDILVAIRRRIRATVKTRVHRAHY